MNQLMKIFSVVGLVWFNMGLSTASAEGQMTTKYLIEQAEKIYAMEKQVDEKHNINIVALKRFLEDKDPKIRAIAVDLLGQSNNPEAIELVKKQEEDNIWFVRRASKMVRTARELREMTTEERWQGLKEISQASPRKIEHFARLCVNKGWVRNLEEIESKIPKSKPYLSNEQNRLKIAKKMSVLARTEKRKQAIKYFVVLFGAILLLPVFITCSKEKRENRRIEEAPLLREGRKEPQAAGAIALRGVPEVPDAIQVAGEERCCRLLIHPIRLREG